MYGYEPPQEVEPGGCRDIVTITRAAFAVVFPVIAAAIGGFGYLGLTIWLFGESPVLGLVPVVLAAAVIAWLVRRDRRSQAARRREIDRDR